MNDFLLLFYAFIKVGILGYGGGHSIIPFIQVEAVENYKWISMEEFTDTLAMANVLPGPIAVKMSFMVGYKTAGLSGALVCLLGLILPMLEMAFPKAKKFIPSATGLGLAFTINGYNTVSFFIGSLFVLWFARVRPGLHQRYTVPVASGIIAGESLMGVARAKPQR